MAAVFNLLGAMLGTSVAHTIGSGIIDINEAGSTHLGLVMVLSAIIGAIVWNLITWWLGLPSSSSHALIGALTGVGVASGVTVGLLASVVGRANGRRLPAIEGVVPDLAALPPGCAFAPRCDRVFDRCRVETPPRVSLDDAHAVRCHLYEAGVRRPDSGVRPVDPGLRTSDSRLDRS